MTTDLHSVYLFYIKDSRVEFYEWYDPGAAISDPWPKITELVRNAAGPKNNPPYFADDREFMIMRRKSFVAFAHDGGAINDSGTVKINGQHYIILGIPRANDGKHTFKGNHYHKKIDVTTAGVTRKVPTVYFVNEMTRFGGGKLNKGEYEDFAFTLPRSGTPLSELIEDSGGTNMGPPIPPPALIPPPMPVKHTEDGS